jgi:hypothetical protein
MDAIGEEEAITANTMPKHPHECCCVDPRRVTGAIVNKGSNVGRRHRFGIEAVENKLPEKGRFHCNDWIWEWLARSGFFENLLTLALQPVHIRSVHEGLRLVTRARYLPVIPLVRLANAVENFGVGTVRSTAGSSVMIGCEPLR